MAETELWLVDLDKAGAALEAIEAATPRLSPSCNARFAAMADEAARRARRRAHIALRILLERRLGPAVRGVPFVASASGKPSLATGDGSIDGVSFSLSHTKGLALIAVGGTGPLGVDLERTRPVRMPDARRAPIEQEAVALAAGAPLADRTRDARFLSAWVRIEAVAKARGTGVGPILERLRPDRPAPPPAPPADEGPPVVAHDVPAGEGLFAAVALAAGVPPPALRRLPDTAPAIAALLETP